MKKDNKKYITVYRNLYSKDTTIGDLHLDSLGKFCYTLEDTIRGRGIKIKHHTAIPENQIGYKVGIKYSPGFKRDMLILYTEPDGITLKLNDVSFTYVYFHGGNSHSDTSGCPLVAKDKNIKSMTIYNSCEIELRDIVTDWLNNGYKVVARFINNPYSN